MQMKLKNVFYNTMEINTIINLRKIYIYIYLIFIDTHFQHQR
jgi:hypothetical protein